MRYLKCFVLFIVFAVAIYKRVPTFSIASNDVHDYERAITDLLTGRNPYEWTIESYRDDSDKVNSDLGDHGFSYLPGFLYLDAFLYVVAPRVGVPFYMLWKVPVLLADLAVGFLLVKKFWKSSAILMVIAPAFWFFNPYTITHQNYTYMDPVVILFMFLSLIYLRKDDVLSGTFFALSVVFKTFPVILFPIFFLLSRNRVKFLLACLLIGVTFSIPFMRSIQDFETYLHGSLFVHNERYVQGRPFLFYISYLYNIELFQIIPLKLYSIVSIFGSWIASTALYLFFKVRDKYVLSLLAFVTFYIFTPVLNRTYLMWFLPIFLISYQNISLRLVKSPIYQKLVVLAFWGAFYVFYYWYLVQWEDGFEITHPVILN